MNITRIKEKLEKYKGETIRFKYNGSRNQIEVFEGRIENTYNYVFTIKLDNDKDQRKSFSYTDVLTDSLEIFID